MRKRWGDIGCVVMLRSYGGEVSAS